MTRWATRAVAATVLAVAGLTGCTITPIPIPSGTPSGSNTADCGTGALPTRAQGTLTIATSHPVYPPYFEDGDPANGKGFESAVAYAVAGALGYATEDVTWVEEPFAQSFAPGAKSFDIDINQVSITPDRENAVDFSEGYYAVNQAVVARNDSPIAGAATIAELKLARLGAPAGTTSLDVVKHVVRPAVKPFAYTDTDAAKSALESGLVDGIVVDLPTAYQITSSEVADTKIVGQFRPRRGAEQYGIVLQKGSPLTRCVSWAVSELKASGQLQKIQDKWLAGAQAPYFEQGP